MYTLQEMQQIAQARCGECLSSHYDYRKMKWKCSCMFIWDAEPRSIRQGHWCPRCGGNAKGNIKEMQRLAKQKGGRCISERYVNSHTKLRWKCADGHTWEARPTSIKNANTWCPRCVRFIKEEQCRFVLDKMTGERFVKTRQILNGLELDGYCEELNAAFEYQGEQHFVYIPKWHKTEQNFKDRQLRDKLKTSLCSQMGISKINIHHKYAEDRERLVKHIKERLHSNNIPIVRDYVDWNGFSSSKSEMDALRQLAYSKNGRLLSKIYDGDGTHLLWKCKHNHQWEATPSHIKQNRWCPVCAGKQKLSIERMQDMAARRGGKCLSGDYTNALTHLLWQCAKGHQWKARPNHVKNGSWCPVCRLPKKAYEFSNWSDL